MWAVQCAVFRFRPIIQGDINYFRLPALPKSAIGWILENPYPVGFCAFDVLPGLPHIADMYLHVLPSERGVGYGKQLLEKICAEALAADIHQLSTLVENSRSETAKFLLKQNFYEEHLEIELMLDLPKSVRPTLTELVTYSPERAARLMQQLYDKSFSHTAWYQPYIDVAEIEENLLCGAQIYFLLHAGQPIGFASTNIDGSVAEVEPLGIIREKQGQGFGRKLLQALLYQFAHEGLGQVHLVVWQTNLPALTLYESCGFRGTKTRTFFAKDVAK